MQRLDFNTGWHFSCPDGRDFDVTLPHDAMLNTPRNTEPGFTWFLLAGWRGNDYTYTKNLHITSELINKHLVLEFEGVYCMTTVTVNDRPAAEKAYGYSEDIRGKAEFMIVGDAYPDGKNRSFVADTKIM